VKVRRRARLNRAFLGLLLLAGYVEPAFAEEGRAVLVGPEDTIGYSLSDEWGQWWRRIADRGGRPDPDKAIQQRFSNPLYRTHQMDLAAADYPIGDELAWAEKENAARIWVHSYSAVELGTNVQMKMGRQISPSWRIDVRYDRLYTRDTESDLVQAEFSWKPDKATTPYVTFGVFPRIEKHDTDLTLTVGYKHKDYGDARVRVWALDAFATASYAVATSRGSPLDHLWKQTSAPLGFAAELASIRKAGVRTELYLGGVIPQSKELLTEELSHVRLQDEWAMMFGGLVEYEFPKFPLWLGASAKMIGSHWGRDDLSSPEESEIINEQTNQGRIYMLAVPRRDMRVEAYIRLTQRPEQIITPQGSTSREDFGALASARWQWLLSKTLGFDLNYLVYGRQSEGPPDVEVDGSGQRLVTRLLWHMERVNASIGIGWNPANDVLYDGGGCNISIDLD